MAPTDTPATPRAAATPIDADTNPYVRLEFLQDTVHSYAKRAKGEKPEIWYPAAEAQRLITAGIAKIDTSAKTWQEQLDATEAANAPRTQVVDNGPNAGRPVAGGQARRVTDVPKS